MEKKGVEVTFLGCDEKGTLDYADFDKAIKENTKAIVCTHGSNLTGNKVDVEPVSYTHLDVYKRQPHILLNPF